MSKAYIFPGQGSQFPGMGKALYERSAEAREMMDKANEILGFPITDIMFGESAEDLKATRVTQPAIFIHSVVLARCSGLEAPSMAAMDFEDALRLVAVRASAMQKCCEQVPGTMAAVINLPAETIEEICASCTGIVIPANYNSDGQVVISGEAAAIAEACAKMKEAGAKRALPLPVSGAFHSPLMEPARLELAEAIDKTPFRAPVCPVYQNVTALPSTDPDVIKDNLLRQLTAPVRWTQTIRNMVADGADSFLEIGPGSVLQGLVKRIAPEVENQGISE